MQQIKTTIVYDNTSRRKDLKADWGFSCVIEVGNHFILFDTGGNGEILLHNLTKLDIKPEQFTDVVISHSDFDHIGGLSYILNRNHKAVIHNPISFRGVKYKNKVNYYSEPTTIYEGIYLTGELEESGNSCKREQSLAIESSKGLVVIVGCCHPTLQRIFEAISHFGDMYAVIGGLHGFQEYELLENIEIICPTHCTVNQKKIKQHYPEQYREGGVGRHFVFE